MKLEIKDGILHFDNNNVDVQEQLTKIQERQLTIQDDLDFIKTQLSEILKLKPIEKQEEEYVLLDVDISDKGEFIKLYDEYVVASDIIDIYNDYKKGYNFQKLKDKYSSYKPKTINNIIFNKRNDLVRDKTIIATVMHRFNKHHLITDILDDLNIDKGVYDYIIEHNKHLIEELSRETVKSRGRSVKFDLETCIEIYELYNQGNTTVEELADLYNSSVGFIYNLIKPSNQRTRKDFLDYIINNPEKFKNINNKTFKINKNRKPIVQLTLEAKIEVYLKFYEDKVDITDLIKTYNISKNTIMRIIRPTTYHASSVYQDLLEEKGYKYHYKGSVAK